ncbi:MAG: hypothetical protein KY467_08315 [Gemmatimonadetes bacterium]|nr:hypothetical protein [Gemmatimonadota bacterium]
MTRSVRNGVVAGCLGLLAACGSDPTGIEGKRMELEDARRLWQAQGIDDYRMTVRLTGAWFGGAAVIRVRDGVPVSVQPVNAGQGVTAETFASYDTVEELFAIVERAVAEGAHRLDAEYHARLGLPVNVFVDPIQNAIDEEHGFVVEVFEPQ